MINYRVEGRAELPHPKPSRENAWVVLLWTQGRQRLHIHQGSNAVVITRQQLELLLEALPDIAPDIAPWDGTEK